jgi:allophanate hydrolase
VASEVGSHGIIPDTRGWTLGEWLTAQRTSTRPDDLVLAAHDRLVTGFAGGAPDSAWISVADSAEIRTQLDELRKRLEAQGGDRARLPLFGVPCAVKDNIDVARFPTTAACPAFSTVASEDARVVELLRAAGAIFFGKTNLDQFATGLVGTRSPYGTVPSEFDKERIGGGSSSGSAAVVSRGLVPFALGTDTAGSGRVPAAFQNIVGLKPTRGRWSTRGVVPACRTLDCVSVFTLTAADAQAIDSILADYDAADPYARRPQSVSPRRYPLTVGVPSELRFFGDDLAAGAFESALGEVRGVCRIEKVDFTPFYELAKLLYAESWVAERALTVGSLLENPSVLDPTVYKIIAGAQKFTARDAFSAEYERARLARQIDQIFEEVDLICVPTTPTAYRIEQVAQDPVGTNSTLGTYTNFTNLADLSGLAVPGPFRQDEFPAGITLLGRAHREGVLLRLGALLGERFGLPLGATGRRVDLHESKLEIAPVGIPVVVVGAHLSGMRLNYQLTERGARLRAETRTSPNYRLHLLDEPYPPRPALRRVATPNLGYAPGIVIEVWDIPEPELGGFLTKVSKPLGLGQVELRDGSWVLGFICEPIGIEGTQDISEFGGYREYLSYAGFGS